jgi:heme exporter protein C
MSTTARTRAQRPGRRDALVRLGAVAATTLAAAAFAAAEAPPDAVQGEWQKLMYLHVPAAWCAYASFAVALVASAAHLRTRSLLADRWALAATEAGVAWTALALVSGSIWGRAVWGVWWAWDPRLVSTALLFVAYVACLGVRGTGSLAAGRRRAAWTAAGAFALVPVVHFSVLWWTGLHQQATLLADSRQVPPIDPRMALALGLAVVAASAVSGAFLIWRVGALDRPDDEAAQRPGGASVEQTPSTVTAIP